MARLPRTTIRLGDLSSRKGTEVVLEPDADERAAIADVLGIPAIRKLRFAAQLTPEGRRDWHLDGVLGATVVQDCVVTLAPVTSRIDETVTRNYVADLPAIDGTEIEMPEDDTVESLPETLDLGAVMIEALALALPPYPRAAGASVGEAVFTEPGKTPLRDEDLRPFSGLSALKDRLQDAQAPDAEPGDASRSDDSGDESTGGKD